MRQQYHKRISTFLITPLYLAAVLSNLFVPHLATAQEAPLEGASVEAQTATPPDPKYIYNEQTGRWENGTYAWDPATNTTTPLTQKSYSYNPETGKWDTTEWAYNDKEQSYTAQPTNITTPPPSANVPSIVATPSVVDGQQSTESAATTSGDSPATLRSQYSQSNLVTNSDNPDSDTSSTFFNGFYNASISVSINSNAQSGDALVVNNTVAGNATSGQALATASTINMLQSTWGLGGGQSPNYYNLTIQGGHTGDLVIDPQMQNSQSNQSQDLVVNQSNNTTINNQLTVTAQSGNANVSNNGVAGDSTTGDAYALVNLMNLVNSSIAAQQSFVAVLNVLGDFEGDVLLPPELQRQLAYSNGAMQMPLNASTQITNDNKTDIQTSIDAQAQSGEAAVKHNTIGGDASSGTANTSVMVYNLTGQQVIAENAVLVFVNVLGQWVGFITNAPSGSRAAILSSSNSATNQSTTSDNNLTATIDNQTSITNDIVVRAQTGEATVDSNTRAGNASTGDAYALANVMNVTNSSINLRGWFAVMFINIMGNWHGSFGTDTQYGGYSQPTGGNGGGDSSLGNNSSVTTQIHNKPTMLGAESNDITPSSPRLARQQSRNSTNVNINTTTSNPAPQGTTQVLADNTTPLTTNIAQQLTEKSFPGVILLIATATTLGAILVFRSKGA